VKLFQRLAVRAQSEPGKFVPKREVDEAQRENERLRKENDRLQREREQLQRDREWLRQELDAALRANKRQAAPHSRGTPTANPKRPGRRSGGQYGRQAGRPIPTHVDEAITVPCPAWCPHCGRAVAPERGEPKYEEDIVRQTVVRRFDITIGRCQQCHRPVQAGIRRRPRMRCA
jgi:hypothetical protein